MNRENRSISSVIFDYSLNGFIFSILFALVIGVIIAISTAIYYTIVSTYNLLTSLEAVVLVALISGVISVFCIVLAKFFEAHNVKNSLFYPKRLEVYSRIIDLIRLRELNNRNVDFSEADYHNHIEKISKELFLCASPRMTQRWLDFILLPYSDAKGTWDIIGYNMILSGLIRAMRKDLGMNFTISSRRYINLISPCAYKKRIREETEATSSESIAFDKISFE